MSSLLHLFPASTALHAKHPIAEISRRPSTLDALPPQHSLACSAVIVIPPHRRHHRDHRFTALGVDEYLPPAVSFSREHKQPFHTQPYAEYSAVSRLSISLAVDEPHNEAMPHRLDTHVLTVDPNVIHKVDTANLAHLSSIWTVFSRCADSVDQGRRLENLSWRLWQREQLVENDIKAAAPTLRSNTVSLPQNICADRLPEVPQLSGSVESVADNDEAIEFTSVSAPLEIARPRILRQDSSSRRDRHISSDDFEKMIMSIVKDKAPLSAPTSSQQQLCKPAAKPLPSIQRSGSTTTESQSSCKESDMASEPESQPSPEMPSRTTVVRGFSPSQVRIPAIQSLQPGPSEPIPEPSSEPAAKPVQSKKLPTTFKLGASCSSSEQGASIESRQPVPKKTSFQIGVSSEEEGSLRSAVSRRSALGVQKKHTSFSNDVSTRTIEHADTAIDSDSEDYVDESAIDDDDDSSDWEDSLEDNSGKSSIDEKFFQRVDSTANLTSRRSLITLALAQNDRSQSTSALRARSGPNGLNLRTSPKTGSPNDSDEAPLMMKGMRSSNLKPIREVPRSGAQPIQAAPTYINVPAAHSPRTNRRTMLATELTDSLRRDMIWERQQKSRTANAVKRRHTSTDLVNLQQHPDKACMKKQDDNDAERWNEYFAKEQFDGYHSKGW